MLKIGRLYCSLGFKIGAFGFADTNCINKLGAGGDIWGISVLLSILVELEYTHC